MGLEFQEARAREAWDGCQIIFQTHSTFSAPVTSNNQGSKWNVMQGVCWHNALTEVMFFVQHTPVTRRELQISRRVQGIWSQNQVFKYVSATTPWAALLSVGDEQSIERNAGRVWADERAHVFFVLARASTARARSVIRQRNEDMDFICNL